MIKHIRPRQQYLLLAAGTIALALSGCGPGGSNVTIDCDNELSLLDPITRCNPGQNFKREYEDVEDSLAQWIEQKKQEKLITHASVYFRDLQNGPWFGIGEDEEFSSASLLKVPIMIAFLKEAEKNPALLEEQLSFTGTMDIEHNVLDATQTIEPDTYYTAEELLRRMVAYSDNYSMELIRARLQAINPASDTLADTYKSLGFIWTEEDIGERPMTVKSYSSVFRVLYNGTYLSEDMSQKALLLLSEAIFPDGLLAGLPPGLTVAHKFGVRGNNETLKQLHDCGIVYAPGNPYLLCIMTRGPSIENNARTIAEITQMIHAEVLKR